MRVSMTNPGKNIQRLESRLDKVRLFVYICFIHINRLYCEQTRHRHSDKTTVDEAKLNSNIVAVLTTFFSYSSQLRAIHASKSFITHEVRQTIKLAYHLECFLRQAYREKSAHAHRITKHDVFIHHRRLGMEKFIKH